MCRISKAYFRSGEEFMALRDDNKPKKQASSELKVQSPKLKVILLSAFSFRLFLPRELS